MNLRHLSIALALVCLAATNSEMLAQEHLTGMFQLSHTSSELLDPGTAQAISEAIPVDEELQWQVYVPETFSVERPPGILVFVDPNGCGGIPDQWRRVFDSHNLIWIGASTTSRNPPLAKQVWQAILAARARALPHLAGECLVMMGAFVGEMTMDRRMRGVKVG